jgi:Tfp pilus assembly protein PilV
MAIWIASRWRRARAEDGFGMLELVLAMTMLVVGVFAVFGMFSSGVLTIKRASTISTASVLADAQMENFRAVRYETIAMTSASVTGADTTYKTDSAYKAPGTNLVNEAVTATGASYLPTQTVTGADNEQYRVDTYITWIPIANGGSPSTAGRNVKLVTIVVRDTDSPYRVWSRVSSSFDQATGS